MNLLKSVAAVSFATLFSRILGLIRDTILAQVFGAGTAIDAFLTAFKIPNMFRRIFSEGAFAQSFVPILANYRNKENIATTRMFISCVTGVLGLILILFTTIGIAAAPWVITSIAPGFTSTIDKFMLTTVLLRNTFPYIFLISITSLISSVLNTWNRFLVPAFAPVLLNISIISFALLVSPLVRPPILALSWAVIVGGVFQIIYQIPFLKKINMLALPKVHLLNIGVWQVLKKMGPAILGVSVSQTSLVIGTMFSSFLAPGSISWMYYADRLMEFPSGILGVTLGTILLPALSHSVSCGNQDEYSRLLDWGLRLCLILSVPSAVGLGILAHPLTVTFFQYGKFSSIDTLMTQHSLIAYSVGLIGLILVKVLVPGFYSRQDIKTPICAALATLIITQAMNLTFIGPLKHAGLSLATGLASCFNAGILYWQLRRKNLFQHQPGWIGFMYRLFLSTVLMGIALVTLLLILPDWEKERMLIRLLHLITVVTVGIIVYFLSLRLSGIRYFHFFQGTCISSSSISEKK